MHEKSFEALRDFAQMRMETVGTLHPMFHAESKDGKSYIFMCTWKDDAEKDMVIRRLKMAFLALEITEYIFASECWMMAGTTPEQLEEHRKGKSLQHMDGRIEAIFAHQISHKNYQIEAWKIVRDEDGKFKELEHITSLVKPDRIEGRFTELLPAEGQPASNDSLKEMSLEMLAHSGVTIAVGVPKKDG